MSLPDLIGYDLARDDENQGAGLYDHPWDQPARRSIFRNVALPGATAQPIHVEPAAGHHLDKPGRAPSSDRGPAVEPSSSEPTKNGATGGNRGAATTKE